MKKIKINIFAYIDENDTDIEDIMETLQDDLYQICEDYDIRITDVTNIID